MVLGDAKEVSVIASRPARVVLTERRDAKDPTTDLLVERVQGGARRGRVPARAAAETRHTVEGFWRRLEERVASDRKGHGGVVSLTQQPEAEWNCGFCGRDVCGDPATLPKALAPEVTDRARANFALGLMQRCPKCTSQRPLDWHCVDCGVWNSLTHEGVAQVYDELAGTGRAAVAGPTGLVCANCKTWAPSDSVLYSHAKGT